MLGSIDRNIHVDMEKNLNEMVSNLRIINVILY